MNGEEYVDVRIKAIAEELRKLYAQHCFTYTSREIASLWYGLNPLLQEATFEQCLSVLRTINNKRAIQCVRLAVRIAPLCDSVEKMRSLWPYIPKCRREIRRSFAVSLIELAMDKSETVAFLKEFEII